MPNRRYDGDYGPRPPRKRPVNESAPTGDRKRVNQNYIPHERPHPKGLSSLHLSTSSKGRSDYPVQPSPSEPNAHENTHISPTDPNRRDIRPGIEPSRDSNLRRDIKPEIEPTRDSNIRRDIRPEVEPTRDPNFRRDARPEVETRDSNGRNEIRPEFEPVRDLIVCGDNIPEYEITRDSNFPGRNLDVLPPAGENNGVLSHSVPLGALAEYSELIATRSALIHQRAVLQEKVGRIKSREDRWQKYYNSFVSLAEDYDRESKITLCELASIENKIKQNSDALEAVARTLMSTVLENITPLPAKFEEEIGSWKKDIGDNKALLKNLEDKVKRLEKPANQFDLEEKLHTILVGYERKMEEMTDHLNKMQLKAEGHQTLLSRVPAIEARVHRFDDFESAAADTLMENAGEIESLKKKIETVVGDLSRENPHENMRDFETEKKQLEELALSLQVRLDKNARDTEIQRERVEALAMDMEKGKTSEMTLRKEIGEFPIQLTSVEGDLRGRIDFLEQDLRPKLRSLGENWQKAQLNFQEQQQLKDDAVSLEIDRIDDRLILLENAIGVQRPVDGEVQQKLQVSPPKDDKQSQTENLWQLDEVLRMKVEQLESTLGKFMDSSTGRTDRIEVLLHSQQQRFDNLTTETLAKSIINYMRLIYPPHPGNLAEYVRTNFHALQEQRTSMIAMINANAARCQQASERFPTLCNKVENLHVQQKDLEKKISEVSNHAETGFDAKIGELRNFSAQRFDSLDREWADLKQVSSTQFKDLQTFVGSAGNRLTQVEASTTKDVAAIQNMVNANEARLDKVEARQVGILATSAKKPASSSEPHIKTRDSDTYSCSSDSDPPISTLVRRSNRESNRGPRKDNSIITRHLRNGRPRSRYGPI